MCGRIATTLPHDAMAQLFAAAPANDLPQGPNFNVCPTDQIAVVTGDAAGRKLRAMRWGFIPEWYKTPSDGPLLINARGETISQKPAFAEACQTRRCLIPACGFYEWTNTPKGARLPWYISAADGAPLVMAGVWQVWGNGDEGDAPLITCAVVTTQANDQMSAIHKRMPVLLKPDDWGKWLGEEGKGAATLMRAPEADFLRLHRVDPAVNSNRAEGSALIEPLE